MLETYDKDEGKEMVEGEGFEPSKAEPSDLQSDPFGRSGIPPQVRSEYYQKLPVCEPRKY